MTPTDNQRMGAGPTWVFGYGSLVWRPAFAHCERRPAAIDGWMRRFWQGSPDHRGVPGHPGRVVTLLPSPGARCDGMAFRVDQRTARTVFKTLDHREQGGYDRVCVRVRFHGGGECAGVTYVAAPGNPHYLGPAPLVSIAAEIAGRCGPSGRNDAYVYELADALRAMGATDNHVFALERLLRRRALAAAQN